MALTWLAVALAAVAMGPEHRLGKAAGETNTLPTVRKLFVVPATGRFEARTRARARLAVRVVVRCLPPGGNWGDDDRVWERHFFGRHRVRGNLRFPLPAAVDCEVQVQAGLMKPGSSPRCIACSWDRLRGRRVEVEVWGRHRAPAANSDLIRFYDFKPGERPSLEVGDHASVAELDDGFVVGRERMRFAYQWQRCTADGTGCADISGATTDDYEATDADVGSTLQCLMTVTNPDGAVHLHTALTQPVRAPAPE